MYKMMITLSVIVCAIVSGCSSENASDNIDLLTNLNEINATNIAEIEALMTLEDSAGLRLDWTGVDLSFVIDDANKQVLSRNYSGGLNNLGIWSAETGELKTEMPLQISTFAQLLTSAPESDLFALADGEYIEIWGKQSHRRERILHGHTGFVYALAFSLDGSILASSGADQRLQLWKLPSGGMTSLDGHTGFVYALAFSADGLLLASAGEDHTIQLWDTQSGELLTVLSGHLSPIQDLDVSANDELLASVDEDGEIVIWDLATYSVKERFTMDAGGWHRVAFGSDDLLVSSRDGDLYFWNTAQSILIDKIEIIPFTSIEIGFSQNQKMLYVSSLDGISVWGIPD
jgi:WD40 repeat protein